MSNTNTSPQQNPTPSFFRRIPLAFGAFFSILSDAKFAARVQDLHQNGGQPLAPNPTSAPVREAPKAAPRPMRESPTDAALQLLGLLQRDARLIDFTEENLTDYSDADIGAAARVVHEGCRKVLREHFTIEPVRPEAEGSRVSLNEGFDARAIRLTGNVVGKPPFHGSISHRGWRATDVRLPKLAESHDAGICAQAEVEL
ncbi:MAG: DUF2760 domain-containing protein [bacterium]